MTQRAFNFSAGPAVLPEPVLEQAQRELLVLPGARASVMEISHRSGTFKEIIAAAEANLRTLLAIPDNYSVLFLQGGARQQFSMVPMNLLTPDCPSADYILTGAWGRHALKEAHKCGAMRTAWDGSEGNFSTLPPADALDLAADAAYVHYTSNETIQGVQFPEEPATGDVPLVCDASSDFLHRPLDISRYGLIYACAQKNIGPAGVTVVVIRNDLLERSCETLPSSLNYQAQAKAGSLLNTAPTFAIYIVRLVTEWLLHEMGGLDKMYALNQAQAEQLYQVIDRSAGFYEAHAEPTCRSLMNVVFRLPNDELTAQFISEAAQHHLTALAGHRSVGGIRASIYNAMPAAGVTALADFMADFRNKHAN